VIVMDRRAPLIERETGPAVSPFLILGPILVAAAAVLVVVALSATGVSEQYLKWLQAAVVPGVD